MSLIFGLIIGLVAGIGVSEWRHRIKPRVSPKPAEEHKFGHRWPPVSTLRRQLPDAPSGCAWEIKVTTNERGHNLMHLTLVDVASEKDVATKDVNLTWNTQYGQTWAQCYRKWSPSIKGDFDSAIIGTLVDFAYAEVYKRQSGSTTDYVMG